MQSSKLVSNRLSSGGNNIKAAHYRSAHHRQSKLLHLMSKIKRFSASDFLHPNPRVHCHSRCVT
jgi:hypothetical protein